MSNQAPTPHLSALAIFPHCPAWAVRPPPAIEFAKTGLAAAYQGSVSPLAITTIAAIFADRASIGAITLILNCSGAIGHHAHRADHFFRQCQRHHNSHGSWTPRSRGEAVRSGRRRCGAVRVHDGVGVVVAGGFDTVGANERPNVALDQRGRRVRGSGGHDEALPAPCRGWA